VDLGCFPAHVQRASARWCAGDLLREGRSAPYDADSRFQRGAASGAAGEAGDVAG